MTEKQEEICKCGHDEIHHHEDTLNCGLTFCPCKKFTPKKSGITIMSVKEVTPESLKKAFKEPKNHSPGEILDRLQRGGNTRKVALSKAPPLDTKEGTQNHKKGCGEIIEVLHDRYNTTIICGGDEHLCPACQEKEK